MAEKGERQDAHHRPEQYPHHERRQEEGDRPAEKERDEPDGLVDHAPHRVAGDHGGALPVDEPHDERRHGNGAARATERHTRSADAPRQRPHRAPAPPDRGNPVNRLSNALRWASAAHERSSAALTGPATGPGAAARGPPSPPIPDLSSITPAP